MRNPFRRLANAFTLLRQGRFFLFTRSLLTTVFPERLLGMTKSVFYRLERSEIPPPPRDPDGLEIFRGDEEAVRRLVRDLYADSPTALEFYERYYRDGVEPWLTRDGEKIVGVVWLFTGSYLVPWEGYDAWLLRVEVEPTARFMANGLVDPKYRNRGIFSILINRCVAAYPESLFYSCVDESNIASIKTHEKNGFHRCGAAWLVRFFGTTRCLFRSKRGKSRFLKLPRGVPVPISLTPYDSSQTS